MKDISGLYLITDESLINKEDYFNIIHSVLIHRPKFIQLRAKDIDKREILFKAKKIREIANKYNVKFIVNDYLDVAMDSQADGIHIGQLDEDYLDIKKEIGKDKIIGVSCYGDIERCIKFSELGADYIAIGTPYFTKTKPNRVETSFSKMKEIVNKVRNPSILAIGGIDSSNVDSIMDVGVDGVAVINSVFGSSTPSKSTLELINILNKRI